MKKTLLLLCAFVASIATSWGQDNLAIGGTAIATSGNASLAIDGDNGTRWESASSDPQTWQLDLGEAKTFNAIKILWEGAYGKTFTIEAGNNVDADGYLTGGTEIVNINSQTLEGFPYTQTLSFDATTARYIKFNGVARGTGWGYSFWEFGVYNLSGSLALTTLTISAPTTSAIAGNTVTLTAAGKDQLGGNIATGDLTWESSNSTVGTVANGVFTALAAGTTTITAKNGGVVSNGVEITVPAGSKIDLFTNWQYRIYPLGADTKAAGRDGLVDASDASLWEMHAATDADEKSRTYETGFIADLGAIYDITSISIKFEGACSADYTISVAGDDGVFGDAKYTVSNHAGMTTYTENHTGQSVTGARYVKFLSTKAATQYGVKIYDFTVVGTKTADAASNATTPSITAATISNPTETSLTLNVTSSDDSPYLLYLVTGAGADRWLTGKQGTEESFVLGGLEAGTTYNINVTAYDAAAHGSAIENVSGTTTGGIVDTENPVMTKATVAPAATTATLTVSATDDSNGTLTYTIKKEETVLGTITGTAGADATYTITGLTAETTYTEGTFTVIATDAAGHVSTAINVPAFTTTEKPMGDEISAAIKSNSPDVNGKLLNYTWAFTQSGTNVTVTFAYSNGSNNDGQGITGLVDGFVYADGVEKAGLSYTWENCEVGQTLTAQHKWLFYEGDYYSPIFTYVVAGDNAGLVKQPADENGINEVLGTGAISADAFKNLTTAEEKAYDLTNLKVTSAVTLEANNANAVFIVKESQKANLSGTKNLLVWDETNSRYSSDEITITDQPGAFNLFASDLTIYTKDAEYIRESVPADLYFTLALPFAGSVPSGFSAYTAGKPADGKVTFTKNDGTLAVANPYVVHNVSDSPADFTVTATGVNAVLNFTETTPANSCMKSVFTKQTTSSETANIYVLMADTEDAGKVVFHAAKGVTLIPFRAVFETSETLSGARAIFDDGETTAIGHIDANGDITVDGAYYDLAGRRVENPAKGIFIHNGKKVVIK